MAINKHSGPYSWRGICSFVYDDKLKQVAGHDVKLNEATGRTWCNGGQRLARVSGGMRCCFQSATTSPTKPLAQSARKISVRRRYMTVLLKLREQDGRVLIEQDDDRLGKSQNHKDMGSGARRSRLRKQRSTKLFNIRGRSGRPSQTRGSFTPSTGAGVGGWVADRASDHPQLPYMCNPKEAEGAFTLEWPIRW